ncbi:MAG: hypothetical protein U5N56_10550 [Candidatus Marinimicrobia bacterium]|nr:hypothetical protein [Candidatus Neomarinimicrobiota bacterium]
MVRYSYDPGKNMIMADFTGNILIHDIIDFMREINSDKTLPAVLNIFIDARKARFTIEPAEIPRLAAMNYKMDRVFQQVNNAILTDNPNETALALLYEYASRSNHYHVKLFSLYENALSWLKNISKKN